MRDKIIYTPNALSGKNTKYVWEDPNHKIHVSDMAIIVLELLEDELVVEKAKANVEAEKKKKELNERRTNSVYTPTPGLKP